MDFEKVREAVEDYASEICSDVNAPASHLPERVVDWIAQAFIDDYLDEGEERLPDYNDVLKGMCDYLQEECSKENKGEITESEFQVTITETSKMTVTVEANSPEDAKQIACDNWHKGEYILDADNFVDVDFEVKKGET